MKDNSKKGKVIPFPGLGKRLLDRGMDALMEKRYKEASEFLNQAVEIDEDNYNAQFGLIVALVELGDYGPAKEHCRSIMNKGIGDYFQVMEMYVMILLQLNEYDEMESTVQALLEDGYVPPDKEEHFEKMLEFCRKMQTERAEEEQVLDEYEEETGPLQLLDRPYEEQVRIVAGIRDDNVRKYLLEIKDYLQSPDGYPFLKTMLLLILKEQEVQDSCDVEKFLKHTSVVPAELENLEERDFFVQVKQMISDQLEHENPTLWLLAEQLLERHHYLMFPFDPDHSFESWAAAYHFLAAGYQGFELDEQELIGRYQAETAKFQRFLDFIMHIEEISTL